MDDNPYRSPAPVPPEPPAPESVGPDGRVRTARDIRAIARGQRGVIACILANIVGMIVLMATRQYTEPFAGFVGLAILAFAAVNLYFAAPLGYRVGSVILGVGAGLASLIPCVGLLALVLINQRATKILRAAGLRVGFFGVSSSEIRRRFPPGPAGPGP